MNPIKVVLAMVIAWHLAVAFFMLPTMFTRGEVPAHLKDGPIHQYAEWLQKKAECLK